MTKLIRTTHLAVVRRRLFRRPRSTKEWLIAIVATGALLTIKLTVGVGGVLLIWHLLQ